MALVTTGEKVRLMEKSFMTVDEVAEELKVSKSYAYKVVRELNAEMQELGYRTKDQIFSQPERVYAKTAR